MKNWRKIILILIVILLQVSLVPSLRFFNSLPNLPLIFLFIYLIKNDDYTALWWVAFGGLLMDIFSTQFFGYFSLQFLFIFLFYRSVVRPLLHDPEPPVIFVIFLVFHFLIFILDGLLDHFNPLSQSIYIVVYQSVIALVFYLIFTRLSKSNRLLLKI